MNEFGRNNDFSRLELSASGLLANYTYFRSKLEPQTKLLVLMKANGYGHGAVELAAMLQQAGADYLAVALPVEGIELRKAGISLPILVLTAGTDAYEDIIKYRLEPGIPKYVCPYQDTQGAFKGRHQGLSRPHQTGYRHASSWLHEVRAGPALPVA